MTFQPLFLKNDIPEQGEKQHIQVNKSITFSFTLPSLDDENDGKRKSVNWIKLDHQKIKIVHTIRVYPQERGAEKFWYFRCLGLNNYIYMIAVTTRHLQAELLFYEF